MAGVISISDKHGHIFLDALGPQRRFGKISTHAEKVDHSCIFSYKHRGQFRVRYTHGVDREVRQLVTQCILVNIQGLQRLLGIGFQHNVRNAQATHNLTLPGGIFHADHLASRSYPFFSLRQAEKPGLAGTHHYHGISRLDVDCDLGRGTGHIHQRQAKLVAKVLRKLGVNAALEQYGAGLTKDLLGVHVNGRDLINF